MNNQQIAQELGISHKTVFSHKINIMKNSRLILSKSWRDSRPSLLRYPQ
ncbi:LuxR C-terminal-related transcriptional regulator [Klebsiella variicola subsp. variicola]|nr:LuxR C-terminal-related transcriptional regulator [Klebsiella variicola subsp. variicola]